MNNVLFRRGNQTFIDKNVPLNDGQIIFNETDEAIYVDTTINNVVTRKRYGGGNLSRSDLDSALSDTSKNPVQNKAITESVLQKTDVVNDYNTAVAVTATDIPVGCGVIKTANTKIGDLQTALNTTNGTVAQHKTDISVLNTGFKNIYKYAHDSNSIAYSSDGVAIIGAKVGRIVCITIYWANKVVSNGTLLYTLPSGQRPIVPVYARNGFDNQHGHISISTDGQVVYVSNQGDADYLHTSVTYVADS